MTQYWEGAHYLTSGLPDSVLEVPGGLEASSFAPPGAAARRVAGEEERCTQGGTYRAIWPHIRVI